MSTTTLEKSTNRPNEINSTTPPSKRARVEESAITGLLSLADAALNTSHENEVASLRDRVSILEAKNDASNKLIAELVARIVKLEGRSAPAQPPVARALPPVATPSDVDWIRRGLDLDSQERFSEALECFEQAVKINPKNDNAWFLRGLMLQGQGKLPEALECYEQAVKINPKNLRWQRNMAEMKAELAQRPQQLPAQALPSSSSSSSATAPVVNVGNRPRPYAGPYYAGPVQQLPAQALPSSSSSSPAVLPTVNAGNRQQNFRPAVQTFDAAWTVQGDMLYKQCKFPEALVSFERAVEINPRNDKAWSSRGDVFWQQRKLPEAIASFERAVEINPKDQYSRKCIASIKAELVRSPQQQAPVQQSPAQALPSSSSSSSAVLPDALEALKQEIKKNPDNDIAWTGLGVGLLSQGKFSLALGSFKRAIAINPSNQTAQFGIASSLERIRQEGGQALSSSSSEPAPAARKG